MIRLAPRVPPSGSASSASLERALAQGKMAGRRVADEVISPEGAAPERVVPEGAAPIEPGPRDDWLVQPDQVEQFLEEDRPAR